MKTTPDTDPVGAESIPARVALWMESTIMDRPEVLKPSSLKGYLPLAMAWEIQMVVFSFQANASIKERKKRTKGFIVKVRSLHLVPRIEAVYLTVPQLLLFLVSLIWKPPHLHRTICKVEPSLVWDVYPRFRSLKSAAIRVVTGTWYSPFQGDSGHSLSLVAPSQKGGRNFEAFVWTVVARFLRKLEEFRI